MAEQIACVTAGCNSLLDKLVAILLPPSLVNFLNTGLVRETFIILNLWSFVHFFVGVLFFHVWRFFSRRLVLGFVVWVGINVLFEGIEFTLAFKGLYPSLFFEETVDIIWDVVFSLAGFLVFWIGHRVWKGDAKK